VAAEKGDTTLVVALVKAGTNIDAKDYKCSSTTLMWAAQKGHLDIVRALLKAGANVDSKNKNKCSAVPPRRRQQQRRCCNRDV
jgi:uncharacterized protein